jgi:hypothetical protein
MSATDNAQPDHGEIVDADVMPELRQELVPVTSAPTLAVTPTVQATELVARLDVIKQAQEDAMVEGVDYGVIPGTNKPTLLKPGAEKLSVLFQLDVQLVNEKTWGPGDHLTVSSHATVFHAPSRARLGYGEGLCTTRETKYAKRKQERTCPQCGVAAVIKGKAEYGGGWLCFRKRGGCGEKWPDDAPEIMGQPVGEVENPDLPDLWNTILKMAEKRARVDAVLAVTGASALFTQDAEDLSAAPDPEPVPVNARTRTQDITATPPQATERVASAEQRGLINARATEKRLGPVELLNVVRAAAGHAPVEHNDDARALQALNRSLDRLPAALVTPIVDALATIPSPEHGAEVAR